MVDFPVGSLNRLEAIRLSTAGDLTTTILPAQFAGWRHVEPTFEY